MGDSVLARAKEHDLSWHDWTIPRDLSDDGKMVSFDEISVKPVAQPVRSTCAAPTAHRLCAYAEGASPSFSPDGKWVLGRTVAIQHALQKLPTGAGESTTISTGDVQKRSRAVLLPGWAAYPAHGQPIGARIEDVGAG